MDTIRIDDKKSTLMVAHRGLSGIERENTCSAFVAAGNRSYFGIECDVHRTADGRYVIIHDDNTERVAMDRLEVESSTYETLRSLRLTDKNGERGRIDLRIPSLEEYISRPRHRRHSITRRYCSSGDHQPAETECSH